MRFLLSRFILAVFVGLGCTPRPRAPEAKSVDQMIIGKVGSALISDKDLAERISSIEKSYPRNYSTHTQKKSLLAEMMNTELLYEEAMRLELDKKYEFKSRLADLYVRALAEKARDQISEQEVTSFFENNKAAVEQVSARHILLKTNASMSSKEKFALKSKLESFRKELLKSPNEFFNYAVKYSEDAARDGGGELGFFTRGMMVAPFSTAAFKLEKIGDISSVVESQFGFHIIQLSGDRRGLEPYRDLIREQLLRKNQRERLDQEISRLKKGKEFQIFEENLVKLSPLPKEVSSDPRDLIPEGSIINETKK